MGRFWVYILKCSDGSYYTGFTDNLSKRIDEHNHSRYPGYTANRLPVKLVYLHEFSERNDAASAEKQIKGWSRKKKEALIAGNYKLLPKLAKCRNENASG